jgi:hypothetical protein
MASQQLEIGCLQQNNGASMHMSRLTRDVLSILIKQKKIEIHMNNKQI